MATQLRTATPTYYYLLSTEDFPMVYEPRPDEYEDDYLDDDGCPECGDGDELDSWQSACIDDLCHGGEVPCMHGDWARLPCGLCGK